MTDGRTLDHGHPISSPCEPNGSGELTNHRIFRKNPDLLQEDVEFLFLKWAHYSKNFNHFYCSFPAVSHMMREVITCMHMFTCIPFAHTALFEGCLLLCCKYIL